MCNYRLGYIDRYYSEERTNAHAQIRLLFIGICGQTKKERERLVLRYTREIRRKIRQKRKR